MFSRAARVVATASALGIVGLAASNNKRAEALSANNKPPQAAADPKEVNIGAFDLFPSVQWLKEKGITQIPNAGTPFVAALSVRAQQVANGITNPEFPFKKFTSNGPAALFVKGAQWELTQQAKEATADIANETAVQRALKSATITGLISAACTPPFYSLCWSCVNSGKTALYAAFGLQLAREIGAIGASVAGAEALHEEGESQLKSLSKGAGLGAVGTYLTHPLHLAAQQSTYNKTSSTEAFKQVLKAAAKNPSSAWLGVILRLPNIVILSTLNAWANNLRQAEMAEVVAQSDSWQGVSQRSEDC